MDNNRIVGIRTFTVSAGVTAASNFIGVFGVYLGSTPLEMGILQSSSTAIINLGQVFWGRISDRSGRRVPSLMAASVSLAFFWGLMLFISSPLQLIIVYSLLSLASSAIAVNWYALLGDIYPSAERGRKLASINNIGSAGNLISVSAMVFILHGTSRSALVIPFLMAVSSYVFTFFILRRIKENGHGIGKTDGLMKTFRQLKQYRHFHKYFMAMNVQGFFWSMAWPLFPITIASVMHFDYAMVAAMTAFTLGATIAVQKQIGKITDRFKRGPLIFSNRLMLSLIPLGYAFFGNFPEFLILGAYSGIVGAIQNVTMNSYLLDVIPEDRRGQFLSIINGANGFIYLAGSLTGGALLQVMMFHYGIVNSLLYLYIAIFAGRLLSSFLFRKLAEPVPMNRSDVSLISVLTRFRTPGLPSGSVHKPK